MKYNWSPTRLAFLDFETQSEAELTTVHHYTTDPSTRVLSCVVKTEEHGVVAMGPYLSDYDLEFLRRLAETHTIVAHNATFDAAVWERTLGLPEAEWYDTLPPARAAGFPGKLGMITKQICGEEKDKNGKLLIELLCKVKNGRVPAIGPAHKLLIDYNIKDVALLEQVYDRVKGFGEPDVMTVDRTINDRGIPVDRQFLTSLDAVFAVNAELSKRQFEDETEGVNPKSPKAVREWLASMGFSVDSIGKATMRDMMGDPRKFYTGDDETEAGAAFQVVQEILEMRKEVVGVGRGKTKAALNALDPDDRLREQLVIYGAGPGRWSGRALQPHNMPLTVQGLDTRDVPPTYTAIKAAAERASAALGYKIANAQVANSMLRHMVRADNLLIADYGAVEARCLAWMAECDRMLEIYANPKASIYLDMGREVFGRTITKSDIREYALAKSLVLGCGYGMSGAKFRVTINVRSKVSADALKSVGISPEEAVKLYRSTYPEIPQLWKDVGVALLRVVGGEVDAMRTGRCLFRMHGLDLHLVLPSGRPIVYRNATIVEAIPSYQKLYGMELRPVPTVQYDHPRGYKTYLYGSKCVENMSQGCCRDFLAKSLVEWEVENFHPVFHVHDEGACEDEDSRFDDFMEIMSSVPEWGEGMPLLCEGYSGPLWSKISKGYNEATFIGGRRV